MTYLLNYLVTFLHTYIRIWGERTRTKDILDYTTTSAGESASSFPSLSRSSEGEATFCRRFPMQKNPKRRRRTFPGVQHVWGVVDKSSGECVLGRDRYHAPPPIFPCECCRLTKAGRCVLTLCCCEVSDEAAGCSTPSTSNFAR